MGSSSSTPGGSQLEKHLKTFVGTKSIDPADPFWTEFLSNSLTYGSNFLPILDIDNRENSLLKDLKGNNHRSKNVGNLIQFLISRSSELMANSAELKNETLMVVQNGLIVLRLLVKYFLDQFSEQMFFYQFNINSDEDPNSISLIEYLFPTLFKLMINIPVQENTYLLHCESILICIILLARQMYRGLPSPLPELYVTVVWSRCGSLAPDVVYRLLTNFIDNRPVPPHFSGLVQYGLMWRAASSIAAGLLTIVTLGYAGRGSDTSLKYELPNLATTTNKSNTDKADLALDLLTSESNATKSFESCQVLSNLSSLLLLVLTTQAGSIENSKVVYTDPMKDGNPLGRNPYRTALFILHNRVEEKTSIDTGMESLNIHMRPAPKSQPGGAAPNSQLTVINVTTVQPINFEAFRDTAALTLRQDSSTLLLYLILHRNSQFRTFIMQGTNYQPLLLPLLNILYRSPSDNSHLVYMALILLLIFTENEQFGRDVHKIKLKWVQWSPSRRLYDISYGSLIILVLCRTIQYHLNQLKDKYLHVNILAALANLSSRMHKLHPYVCDVMINLLQLLIKRHAKIVDQLRVTNGEQKHFNDSGNESFAHTTSSTSMSPSCPNTPPSNTPPTSEETLVQDLSLLDEVSRMLLEIVNSILSHAMTSNPDLIYSLLHKKDSLSLLRTHPSFQNVVQNIDIVMTYFSKHIEAELGPQPTHPQSVMEVIEKYLNHPQRVCNLKRFPDLKFKYVEEESPDEFFIPYVWSVVIRQSGMTFKTESLQLFSHNLNSIDQHHQSIEATNGEQNTHSSTTG